MLNFRWNCILFNSPLNWNEMRVLQMRHAHLHFDKSNWFLIAEYDFDNNRHGFAASIEYAESR